MLCHQPDTMESTLFFFRLLRIRRLSEDSNLAHSRKNFHNCHIWYLLFIWTTDTCALLSGKPFMSILPGSKSSLLQFLKIHHGFVNQIHNDFYNFIWKVASIKRKMFMFSKNIFSRWAEDILTTCLQPANFHFFFDFIVCSFHRTLWGMIWLGKRLLDSVFRWQNAFVRVKLKTLNSWRIPMSIFKTQIIRRL